MLKKTIKFAILTHLHKDHMEDFTNVVKKNHIDKIYLFNSRKKTRPKPEEISKYQNYEEIRCDKINFITTQDISNGLSFSVGNVDLNF